MNRRKFLLSTAAVIVGAKLPAIASVKTEVYSLSPLPMSSLKFLEELTQGAVATFIYGNDEWTPTQFTGFIPRYGK